MKKIAFYALITAIFIAILTLGFTSPALADSVMSATCTATPSNANVGDNVNWQVQNIYGGNGTYTYAWSGTDSLSGNSQTVYKSYAYSGTKYATVTITSGSQVFTASCSTNIGYTNNYNYNYPYGYGGTLMASCYAIPSNPNINEQVTWYGTATGGSGNYIYTWSGTDGLYGNSATAYKTYSTLGAKTAVLSVYSNGQTVTQTCSVNVGNYAGGSYNNCYYNGSYYSCNNYGYNNSYYNGTYYNGYNNYYNGTTYSNPPINQTSYAPTTYTYPTTNYTGTAGTPVSGVFLNQVPSTGKEFNMKMALFLIGLFGWSMFAAFIIQKKRGSLATANSGTSGNSNQNSGSTPISARIEEFKKANMAKKGLLK